MKKGKNMENRNVECEWARRKEEELFRWFEKINRNMLALAKQKERFRKHKNGIDIVILVAPKKEF